MEQYQQYINIDECVLAYLDESEQNKSSRYYKCWQLAYRAADELGLDIFYSIKTERLEVSGNGVATLPADYLSYCKIGQLSCDGEIVSFIRNDGIDNYNGMSCGNLIPNTEATYGDCFYDSTAPVFYNYWKEGGYTHLHGGNCCSSFGTFKIDEANGVLILPQAHFTSSIVMEYKASPSQDKETRIPKQFKEAVIAYIAWKDIRSLPSSRRGNLSDKRDRRHEYFNERRLAKARYQPFYLREAWYYAKTFTPSSNSGIYNYSYDGCKVVPACNTSHSGHFGSGGGTTTPPVVIPPTTDTGIKQDEIVLPLGATSYTVPKGWLIEHILFIDPQSLVVSVGSTQGGGEYVEPIEMSETAPKDGAIVRFAVATITTPFFNEEVLYFTGVTDQTLIKIYRA